MGIDNHRPDNSNTGSGALDTDRDLGHRSDGDTDPLPASNEPKTPGVDTSLPEQGAEDSDIHHAPLDDGLRPTGGNS
jgi:hypothetical protein